MKLLVVATKAPWPPIDGGRLLLWRMLEGLAAAGLRATLVAPVDSARFEPAAVAAALEPLAVPWLVPARLPGKLETLGRALATGRPMSIARHSLGPVRREVARRLSAERFDLVHAEQLQALPQTAPAAAAGVPVLLRAQNVESDLWSAAGGDRAPWIAWEARRLARYEGGAVARAAATVALSPEDAARLWELAEPAGAPADLAERLHVVPAPFPVSLPAGDEPLSGEPPLVILGSGGWLPNEDSAAWFLAEAWPLVRRFLPGAHLHLFGVGQGTAESPGVFVHPAPADSARAFPAGSIHVVPLRLGSGIRMKILEAWARGVPVVATPRAVAGLGARDGRDLLVGEDAPALAAACRRLAEESGLAARLVAGGRNALAERHDPARVARRLLEIYDAVVER